MIRANPRGQPSRNRQQTRALHTGSKAWKILRMQALQRDGYRCRDCKGYGDQVDHRDGDSHNNDIGNLQTLCHVCHSRKTATEMTGAAYVPTGCDARGNPVSPNEYWR